MPIDWKTAARGFGLVGLVVVAFLASRFTPESLAPQRAWAEVGPPITFAAGDSVRYVATFTVPVTAPITDSVVVKWVLGGNPNQIHVFKPGYAVPVRDTVRFVAPPLSPGGSSATGSATIQSWRAGVSSLGFSKAYTINRPGPAAPPDVTGFVFVDSAVAYP